MMCTKIRMGCECACTYACKMDSKTFNMEVAEKFLIGIYYLGTKY